MFDITDFNKRHKTASLKAQYINFDTSLKLTKLQMDDRAYKVIAAINCLSKSTIFLKLYLGWFNGSIL